MVENHTELLPTVVGDGLKVIGTRFQCTDKPSLQKSEIHQLATEFRAHPQRAHLPTVVLENEQTAP